MNKTNPRISVFILTYNRAQLVERSIKSVLNQTFRDFELVLVDNGSTDETSKVFEKYKNIENVRTLRIDKNIGFAGGYNYCLDRIGGEWFAVVGDDDEIRAHALQVLFDVVDKMDPTLTAVNSNGLDSSTNSYSGIGLYEDQYLPIKTIVAKCDGDFWGITKSELFNGKRLNLKIPGLEDTFWYQVDAIANRYYIHQQLITYHTDHNDRETTKQSNNLKKKAILYRELLEESFYWETLKKYNKKQYLNRCMKGMFTQKCVGDQNRYLRYQKMLFEVNPRFKFRVISAFINSFKPALLNAVYPVINRLSSSSD